MQFDISPKMGVAGRYYLYAKSSRGIRDLGCSENIIVDTGLNAMGSAGRSFKLRCVVSSDTATPLASDIWLDGVIAETGTQAFGNGSNSWAFINEESKYIVRKTLWRQFPEGAAAGNISSIAMAFGNSGQNLFSKARILDTFGNPTTITILSDEVLQVKYIHEFHIDPDMSLEQEVLVEGVPTTVTMKWAGIFGYWSASSSGLTSDSWFFDENQGGMSKPARAVSEERPVLSTTSSIGTDSACLSTKTAPYVQFSMEREVTYEWDSSRGNIAGGIGAIVAHMTGYNGASAAGGNLDMRYQLVFNPKLDKNSLKKLTVTVKYGWGRYIEPVVP